MNQYFFDNLRKPVDKGPRSHSRKNVKSTLAASLKVDKIEIKRKIPPQIPEILNKRNHTAIPDIHQRKNNYELFIPKISNYQNREELVNEGIIISKKLSKVKLFFINSLLQRII